MNTGLLIAANTPSELLTSNEMRQDLNGILLLTAYSYKHSMGYMGSH
jgi:hypothetical protein